MSNTGWICPRCQKVHAPHVQGCDCAPLPDLIGKTLPRLPDIAPTQWPFRPLGPSWPEPEISPQLYPMPICGCTGPCANAACPHAIKTTCRGFGTSSTYGDGGTVL